MWCPTLIATTGASTEIQGDPSPVNASSTSSTPPPAKSGSYSSLLTQPPAVDHPTFSALSHHRGSDIIMTSTPDLTGVSCSGSSHGTGAGSPILGEPTNNNTQSIADYLAQLLKDKKQLAAFPNVFLHVERLLDDGKTNINFFLGI